METVCNLLFPKSDFNRSDGSARCVRGGRGQSRYATCRIGRKLRRVNKMAGWGRRAGWSLCGDHRK
jgi:hypothetical protein